jgi:hypothetical protein
MSSFESAVLDIKTKKSKLLSPSQRTIVKKMLNLALIRSGWKVMSTRSRGYYGLFFGYRVVLKDISGTTRELYLRYDSGFWISLREFEPSLIDSPERSQESFRRWKAKVKFDVQQSKLNKAENFYSLEPYNGWEGSSFCQLLGHDRTTELPVNLSFKRSHVSIPKGSEPYIAFPVKGGEIQIDKPTNKFHPLDHERQFHQFIYGKKAPPGKAKPVKLSGKILKPLGFWQNMAPPAGRGLGHATLVQDQIQVYIEPWKEVLPRTRSLYLASDPWGKLPDRKVEVKLHPDIPVYTFDSAPFLNKRALRAELLRYASSGDHGNSYNPGDIWHPVFKMWCGGHLSNLDIPYDESKHFQRVRKALSSAPYHSLR